MTVSLKNTSNGSYNYHTNQVSSQHTVFVTSAVRTQLKLTNSTHLGVYRGVEWRVKGVRENTLLLQR